MEPKRLARCWQQTTILHSGPIRTMEKGHHWRVIGVLYPTPYHSGCIPSLWSVSLIPLSTLDKHHRRHYFKPLYWEAKKARSNSQGTGVRQTKTVFLERMRGTAWVNGNVSSTGHGTPEVVHTLLEDSSIVMEKMFSWSLRKGSRYAVGENGRTALGTPSCKYSWN